MNTNSHHFPISLLLKGGERPYQIEKVLGSDYLYYIELGINDLGGLTTPGARIVLVPRGMANRNGQLRYKHH